MPLPAAAERNRFAQHLFTPLPARYDRLAEVLSMGQNGRWRAAMIVSPRATPETERPDPLPIPSATATTQAGRL